jgi:hypothetical protein
MNRSFGWHFLIGLLPLAFAVVGGVVLYGVLFREWGSGPRQPASKAHLPVGATTRSAAKVDSEFSSQHPDDRLDQEFDGPLKLKPAVSKWVVLGIGLLFGLFWNGIVSFFVFHVIEEGFPIFLTLFMLPFVLVGLGITFFCIYVFLSLFNPKIEVALSNGAVPLGEEVDVAWEVLGNARKIRKLDIHIQGEEIATYRRGTDTHTDTNTFRMIPIVSTDQSDEIPFGTTTVRIPADTMHSLDAGNNQIKWSIQVKGDIPWWPDVNESLIFRVRPFFQ